MPVAALPTVARISELRLAIAAPCDEIARPLNRKAPYAPAYRELWRGELLCAGLAHADAAALAAFLEALDGRVTPFKLSLGAGKFGQLASHTGSLQAVPALGADTVSLNLSPASGRIRAGTLLTVGDLETSAYQLFECVQDVTAASATAVKVAPRVRTTFTLASPVALGTVWAKLRLASDEVDASTLVTHGLVTIGVVEAL
jgi:hypothetical protein